MIRKFGIWKVVGTVFVIGIPETARSPSCSIALLCDFGFCGGSVMNWVILYVSGYGLTVHTPERVYVLNCTNQGKRDEWAKNIEQVRHEAYRSWFQTLTLPHGHLPPPRFFPGSYRRHGDSGGRYSGLSI